MKQLKIVGTLVILMAQSIFSQSDLKLSLLNFNPSLYNAAYVGSFNGLSISGTYSSQWLGFDGAPKTLFLSGYANTNYEGLSLGADIITDKIGPVQENIFIGNYAYHLSLDSEFMLSFGLKTGFNNYKMDYSLLNPEHPTESDLIDEKVSQNSLIVGTGLYIHNQKAYLGLSIPNLLTTKFKSDAQTTLVNDRPSIFINGGYNWKINEGLTMQPNFLTRFSEGASLRTLVAMNLNWNENFIAGLNYEVSSSIGAFLGFRFMENYQLAYSYDTSLNKFSNTNSGIHSVMFNYRIEDEWRRSKYSNYTF